LQAALGKLPIYFIRNEGQLDGRVAYRDLWPGIDLIYSGEGRRLKYEFVVRPGADVEQIQVVCRGAELRAADLVNE